MANTPRDLAELVRRCDPQFVNERDYSIDKYFADLATVGQVLRVIPRYESIFDKLRVGDYSLREIASGIFAESQKNENDARV